MVAFLRQINGERRRVRPQATQMPVRNLASDAHCAAHVAPGVGRRRGQAAATVADARS
jgi:hypothetical protein